MSETDTIRRRGPSFFNNPALRIEARHKETGVEFYAWRPHVSMWFGDAQALLRWVKWPVKTPTGDALRAWLQEQVHEKEVAQ
ncbi:MAG: hypothetical protein ACK41W_02010 [Cyanobacteriota bacterium]|jgi:hypothetical protein